MTVTQTTFFVLALIGWTMDCRAACERSAIEVGRQLFETTALSADNKTGCVTCHDARHSFTMSQSVAVGVNGTHGTRNAPSLLNASLTSSFFWDGRRTSLEESVLDAFTNPVELGLASTDDLVARVNYLVSLSGRAAPLSLQQIKGDLSCYLRSLPSANTRFDRYLKDHTPLTTAEQNGLNLFQGTAGCTACHRIDATIPTFTDDHYHHSGVQQDALSQNMGRVAAEILETNLSPDRLGARVLSDSLWSAAGRFAVTHDPRDMGSFKTPSLRNVAMTNPYMHDGSIATLEEAVDREIYYRALSTNHVVNLSSQERRDIASFLNTLSDEGTDSK